ncbi:MAG TPA: TIGR03435 family protein, partial [Bryobacteraceae bacterium]|nr:TIGR03435 family protein [Bryobacteraceae bacterium]
GSTRYEIVATVPAGATHDDVPLMLQKLIIERFGLTFHREQKEIPGYVLLTGKSGPKLKAAIGSPASIPSRNGFPELPAGVAAGVIKVDSVGSVHRLTAGAMSMAQFADYLAGQSDFPVVDLTNLPGKYDIVLYYSKPARFATNSSALPADNELDLLSAIRDQLRLELQTRKLKVDLLVVDHVEQTPSLN